MRKNDGYFIEKGSRNSIRRLTNEIPASEIILKGYGYTFCTPFTLRMVS